MTPEKAYNRILVRPTDPKKIQALRDLYSKHEYMNDRLATPSKTREYHHYALEIVSAVLGEKETDTTDLAHHLYIRNGWFEPNLFEEARKHVEEFCK